MNSPFQLCFQLGNRTGVLFTAVSTGNYSQHAYPDAVNEGTPCQRISHFLVWRKIPRLRMVSNSIREGDDPFKNSQILCPSNFSLTLKNSINRRSFLLPFKTSPSGSKKARMNWIQLMRRR